MYRDYEFSIDLLNQLNASICLIHWPMYNVIHVYVYDVILMTFVSWWLSHMRALRQPSIEATCIYKISLKKKIKIVQ